MKSFYNDKAPNGRAVISLMFFASMTWEIAIGGTSLVTPIASNGAETITRNSFRYDSSAPNPYNGMTEKYLWEQKPKMYPIGWPPRNEEEARIAQWAVSMEQTAANPYRGKSAYQLQMMKPRMRKADHYPPQNEEEFRMWQWFHAMIKADRDAEWKAPIEFYGKVVNQSNLPLPDVSVSFIPSKADGTTPYMSVKTDAEGRFALNNITGKCVDVLVEMVGSRSFRSAHQHFEYFDIGSSSFHVPDPTNPVIFRLWEYSNPEPMYKHWNVPTVTFSVDDRVIGVDVRKGRLADPGQVGLSVLRNDPTNWLAGYTITIHAAEGGGVRLPDADDELMFQAPANGYQSTIQIKQAPGDVYANTKKLRFYVRTPDNKFGVMKADISQSDRAKAEMQGCLIYFNPSGSRNLQYRDDLRLRDKR